MSDTPNPPNSPCLHDSSSSPTELDELDGVDEVDGADEVAVADAGRALVEVASRHGTTVFFGVVSIHNQPLIDAVAHGARFVPVRHEAAAVNAADAHSRATGGLGVAITSTGTGAGNAAGSLIESLTAGSRVLHVTGNIDAAYLGQGRGVIHETKDQLAMLAAVSKRAESVTSAQDVGAALALAADDAVASPSGPVSVEIPIDVQYRPTVIPRSPGLGPGVRADRDALAAAAAVIRAARRPMLWLGGGAVGARDELERFARRIGAGVVTSSAGRGTIDERDELVIGNFGASDAMGSLWAESDLLISVGTHFRSNETRHYHLELPRPHIQIDVDPAAIGRSYPVDHGLVGDAADVVQDLFTLLDESAPSFGTSAQPDPDWRTQVRATRDEVRERLRADIGPYAVLNDAMRAAAHETSPFVRDVTIPASAWGNRLFDIYDPVTNINPRGGGIGQGLAMGLGAAIARPDGPTLLMVGDGGIAVHLGELATIAQEQPWLVIVLFNDGGYGVLRNLQDAHFERRSGVDLTNPDFAALARSFGIPHRRLDSPADADETLAWAVERGGPVFVEVDCEAFGPMPKPFVPPVPVQR